MYSLFNGAIKGEDSFDISSIIQKNVSGIKEAETVDLIPSSLNMIDIQDEIATIT